MVDFEQQSQFTDGLPDSTVLWYVVIVWWLRDYQQHFFTTACASWYWCCCVSWTLKLFWKLQHATGISDQTSLNIHHFITQTIRVPQNLLQVIFQGKKQEIVICFSSSNVKISFFLFYITVNVKICLLDVSLNSSHMTWTQVIVKSQIWWV